MTISHNTPSEHDLELLSAYLDNALTAREQHTLEQRLATDETLRANLEALRETVTLVRMLPRLSAPRNFMLDPAQYSRSLPWWQRMFNLGLVLQLSGALGTAAAIILIALAMLVTGDAGDERDAGNMQLQTAVGYVTESEREQTGATESGAAPPVEEDGEELAQDAADEGAADFDAGDDDPAAPPADSAIVQEEAPESALVPEATQSEFEEGEDLPVEIAIEEGSNSSDAVDGTSGTETSGPESEGETSSEAMPTRSAQLTITADSQRTEQAQAALPAATSLYRTTPLPTPLTAPSPLPGIDDSGLDDGDMVPPSAEMPPPGPAPGMEAEDDGVLPTGPLLSPTRTIVFSPTPALISTSAAAAPAESAFSAPQGDAPDGRELVEDEGAAAAVPEMAGDNGALMSADDDSEGEIAEGDAAAMEPEAEMGAAMDAVPDAAAPGGNTPAPTRSPEPTPQPMLARTVQSPVQATLTALSIQFTATASAQSLRVPPTAAT
ncbi:MAG: hypothetical protein GYB65_02070, partial [Chloroflexi bacterium]|nr:hypothetical protein [Chloroflexota bacterium]